VEKSLHIEVDDIVEDGLDQLLYGGLDDLERELQQALRSTDHPDDGLDDDMDDVLARSLAGDEGDFTAHPPAVEPEAGDEQILALGDDGARTLAQVREEEVAALRAQNAELSRSLSTYELELKTAEDRVQTLEAQVVGAQRQVASVAREMDVVRRRAEREREDLQKFAGEKILKEFLGVFDNLERAIAHAGPERNSALGQGVDMTVAQFCTALRRLGAERVDASPGRAFDPAVHEAMGQDWHPDVPAGAVAREMQAGFTLQGRLLRASVVLVSRGPMPAHLSGGLGPKTDAGLSAVAGEPGGPRDEVEATTHGDLPLEAQDAEPVTEDMPRIPDGPDGPHPVHARKVRH
jgi:molecular chaperone GrpE